jgi:hypothetical protein
VVQSWIRQALRASGVAILVPAAVAAAIALSVIGGGGDVGSLGQVLAGPAVPPAEASAPAAAAQPRRDERPRTAPAALAAHTAPQRQSPVSTAAPHGARPVTTLPEGARPHPVRPPTASPVPAPSTATSPPAQQQPPPAQSHPINDTGTQVAETVRPLPVAGPVAADTVQAVVNLVDPPA